MPLSFTSLSQGNASAARDLLFAWWPQGWTEAFAADFFDWRYGARPSGETTLVLDDGRCVAILDSFIRPYILNGRRVLVRETCDWFCLPEYRRFGVGIKLMRDLMKRSEPIISVGGLESTLALLPQLKWKRLPDVYDFVLPISARAVTGKLLSRFFPKISGAVRLLPGSFHLRSVQERPPPSPTAEIQPLRPDATCPISSIETYGLNSLLSNDDISWLARAPEGLGSFVGLTFLNDDVAVGLSLSRLEDCESGRWAKILHVEVAPVGLPLIEWVVSETARRLVARGAGVIRCRSSCPWLGEALRRVGFMNFRSCPTYWWAGDGEIPVGPVHLTYNRADDAVPFEKSLPG